MNNFCPDTYISCLLVLWLVGVLAFGLVHVQMRVWKLLQSFLWMASLLVICGRGLSYPPKRVCTSGGSNQQTRVLPFSLSLDSFRVVYYPGTEAPSDYKSYVSYKVNGKWKEEVISMNHILSVKGYRFYQSSYDPDLFGSWLSVNYDPWGIAVTYAWY